MENLRRTPKQTKLIWRLKNCLTKKFEKTGIENSKTTITDYEESNNSEFDESGIQSNNESLASDNEKSNNS